MVAERRLRDGRLGRRSVVGPRGTRRRRAGGQRRGQDVRGRTDITALVPGSFRLRSRAGRPPSIAPFPERRFLRSPCSNRISDPSPCLAEPPADTRSVPSGDPMAMTLESARPRRSAPACCVARAALRHRPSTFRLNCPAARLACASPRSTARCMRTNSPTASTVTMPFWMRCPRL